jgi:hypothetical protein
MKLVSLVLEIEVRKHLLNNFSMAAGAKVKHVVGRDITHYTHAPLTV